MKIWITADKKIPPNSPLETLHLIFLKENGRQLSCDLAWFLTKDYEITPLKKNGRVYEAKPPTTPHERIPDNRRNPTSLEQTAFEALLNSAPYPTLEEAREMIRKINLEYSLL